MIAFILIVSSESSIDLMSQSLKSSDFSGWSSTDLPLKAIFSLQDFLTFGTED